MSEWTPMINESMSTIGLTKDLPKYLENREAVLKLAKFGAMVFKHAILTRNWNIKNNVIMGFAASNNMVTYDYKNDDWIPPIDIEEAVEELTKNV